MLHSGNLHARRAKVSAHYQELELQSKLEAADPYTLVKILYEELNNCFRVLKSVSGRNVDIANHREAHRAHAIVMALLSGLSSVDNSNLTAILADVYHAMAGTILNIIKSGETGKLDELLDGTASMRSAWDQIPLQTTRH